MSEPYYSDDLVTLYHGDFEDILPSIGRVDAIVTDPPYGETSLEWDVWPAGWPAMAAEVTDSMWCFGSMRMFLNQRDEFSEWRLSQDVVWEKHNGSGFHADRFRRIHEHALHWYRGEWANVRHSAPTTDTAMARIVRSKRRQSHTGQSERTPYVSVDGGPKLMESVIYSPSMHGKAINPTEKPVAVLEPLISYVCPPGGVVLDIFAGSGSTGDAARNIGRRSILIEKRESQCELTALRLAHAPLDLEGLAG